MGTKFYYVACGGSDDAHYAPAARRYFRLMKREVSSIEDTLFEDGRQQQAS